MSCSHAGSVPDSSQVSAQRTGANLGHRAVVSKTAGLIRLPSKGAKGSVPDSAQVSAQRTGANLGHRASSTSNLPPPGTRCSPMPSAGEHHRARRAAVARLAPLQLPEKPVL